MGLHFTGLLIGMVSETSAKKMRHKSLSWLLYKPIKFLIIYFIYLLLGAFFKISEDNRNL